MLSLFPEAQFIYVHRDPYEVAQSAAHMADAYYWFCYLSRPTNGDVNDFILNQYELLHKEYIETRSLIPQVSLRPCLPPVSLICRAEMCAWMFA